MELRGVREGQLRGLLGHGAADFGDAVADVYYRCLAAGVEVTTTILINDPAALAANNDGIVFAKISGEEGGVGRHDDGGIVADEKDSERCQEFTIAPRRGAAMPHPRKERGVVGWRTFFWGKRGGCGRLTPLGRAEARPYNSCWLFERW